MKNFTVHLRRDPREEALLPQSPKLKGRLMLCLIDMIFVEGAKGDNMEYFRDATSSHTTMEDPLRCPLYVVETNCEGAPKATRKSVSPTGAVRRVPAPLRLAVQYQCAWLVYNFPCR